MQNRSQETRNQIKSAAVDNFCRSGYDGASVAEICSQAGVSKGAFYHHFPSKQDLFLAIMEDWLKDLDGRLFNQKESTKPVPKTLQEMGSTLGIVFKAASGQLPMFMEFLVQASRSPDIWDAVIAPYRKYQQSFSILIDKGKEEGSFKSNIDAEESAWVLMSLAVGILLQGVLDPEAVDWNIVTNKGVQMVIEALRKGEP
jgi:AcrR family transcriptional regulator